MPNRLSSIIFMFLVGVSFFQLSVNAQKPEERTETTVSGQTAMAWMAYGQLIRFRAFNPSKTELGKANESINVQIKLYDERGTLLLETPTVEIPPGEFRWIDIKREDLNITGDPGTGRVQVRTTPLWGVRTRPLKVPTSLDLVDQTTGEGSFKFYFIIEALP